MKPARALPPPCRLAGGAPARRRLRRPELCRADTAYDDLETFMSVYERVKNNYVKEVDDHTLIKGAIDGMLNALDPHSSYAEASRFRGFEHDFTGNYGGIGVITTVEDGAMKVISATEDTPAWRAGIKSGDYITRVDGKLALRAEPRRGHREDCAGRRASPVKLSIFRRGPRKADRPDDRARGDRRKPVKWEVKDGVGIVNSTASPAIAAERWHQALAGNRQEDQRQDDRLCARPAVERRRSPPAGGRDRRPVPERRRDRFPARPRQGRWRNIIMPSPATSRTAARSSCWSMPAPLRRRRSWPARSGASPRPGRRRAKLRQGVGPDRSTISGRSRRCG